MRAKFIVHVSIHTHTYYAQADNKWSCKHVLFGDETSGELTCDAVGLLADTLYAFVVNVKTYLLHTRPLFASLQLNIFPAVLYTGLYSRGLTCDFTTL
jgi:hypothetical protein